MSAIVEALPGHDGRQPGMYGGTERLEEASGRGRWRRCREAGLFVRGNGEWWCDEATFRFRRFMTREPIVLPFDAVDAVEVDHSTATRLRSCTTPIRMLWRRHLERMRSTFVVARTPAGTEAVAAALRVVLDRVARQADGGR